MSGIAEGQSHENRSIANPMYLRTGDPGMSGGGTYTGSNTQPTLEQYENIFGPAARDIKVDHQRHKRHDFVLRLRAGHCIHTSLMKHFSRVPQQLSHLFHRVQAHWIL